MFNGTAEQNKIKKDDYIKLKHGMKKGMNTK